MVNKEDSIRENLEIMRGILHNKNLIKEEVVNNEEEFTEEDIEYIEHPPAEEDRIEVSTNDEKEFKSMFNDGLITGQGIYIDGKDKNVIGNGTLAGQDGLVQWSFNLQKGLTISTTHFRIDDNKSFDRLKRLTGMFETWKENWGEKLANEYSGDE